MYPNLKAVRRRERKSCADLAKVLSLSTRSAYQKKETGASSFTLAQAKILSVYFGMSIDELFFENTVSEKEAKVPGGT